MIQPSYRRNLQKNYLILEGDNGTCHNYQISMLRENRIQGILEFEVRIIDGGIWYYYDISGRQTIQSIYEKHMMSYENIRTILLELHRILEQAKGYLIDLNHMILDPAYIYCDYECSELQLVFYMDYELEHKNAFIAFAEYLLEHIDHEDEHAVSVGYQLYQEVRKDNFTFEQFLEIIQDKNREVVENERARQVLDVHDGAPILEHDVREVAELNQIESKRTELNQIEKIQDEKKSKKYDLWKVILVAGILLSIAVYMEFELPHYDTEKYLLYGFSFLVMAAGTTHYFLNKEGKVEEVMPEQVPSEQKSQLAKDPLLSNQIMTRGRLSVPPPVETLEQTVYMGNIRREERMLLGNVNQKELRIRLEEFPCTIGKSSEHADLVIDHVSVSRIHARITEKEDGLYLEDLNSVNGTYKNGIILETNEIVRLEMKDEVQLGSVYLEYR